MSDSFRPRLPTQAGPPFLLGDNNIKIPLKTKVRVKQGTKDPDIPDEDLSGFSGHISGYSAGPIGSLGLIEITWDDGTKTKFSDKMAEWVTEGYGDDIIFLSPNDVEIIE